MKDTREKGYTPQDRALVLSDEVREEFVDLNKEDIEKSFSKTRETKFDIL